MAFITEVVTAWLDHTREQVAAGLKLVSTVARDAALYGAWGVLWIGWYALQIVCVSLCVLSLATLVYSGVYRRLVPKPVFHFPLHFHTSALNSAELTGGALEPQLFHHTANTHYTHGDDPCDDWLSEVADGSFLCDRTHRTATHVPISKPDGIPGSPVPLLYPVAITDVLNPWQSQWVPGALADTELTAGAVRRRSVFTSFFSLDTELKQHPPALLPGAEYEAEIYLDFKSLPVAGPRVGHGSFTIHVDLLAVLPANWRKREVVEGTGEFQATQQEDPSTAFTVGSPADATPASEQPGGRGKHNTTSGSVQVTVDVNVQTQPTTHHKPGATGEHDTDTGTARPQLPPPRAAHHAPAPPNHNAKHRQQHSDNHAAQLHSDLLEVTREQPQLQSTQHHTVLARCQHEVYVRRLSVARRVLALMHELAADTLPLYAELFGAGSSTRVHFTCFEGFRESREYPLRGLRVTVASPDAVLGPGNEAVVYTHMHGLAYLMFHWFLTCALFTVGALACSFGLFACLACVAVRYTCCGNSVGFGLPLPPPVDTPAFGLAASPFKYRELWRVMRGGEKERVA